MSKRFSSATIGKPVTEIRIVNEKVEVATRGIRQVAIEAERLEIVFEDAKSARRFADLIVGRLVG
jgi:coenzyme F420-reducing hydrogenase delta subunit